jgi:zinc protease
MGRLSNRIYPLAAILFVFCLGVPRQGVALDIQRVVSPGGVVAWLVSDHSVPVISMEVGWRGGSITDPAGKEGVANLVSGLLDEGAGDLDSQAFQRRLEDLAIGLSFDAGYDNFRGQLTTLTANRDEAFDLFALAISKPRFDEEPVERIRRQVLAGLARQNENVNRVATNRWRELVFDGHPYSRPVDGTPETVAAITVEDLRNFVAGRLARDNLLIAVAGDITAEELAPLLDKTFGSLPATASPVNVREAHPDGGGQVVVIRRAIPQSVAIFGQAGIDRDDPDYYAAYLATYILGGGGFGSRLTDEVREKRGLAYSVGAHMDPNRYGSLVVGYVGTVNPRLADSLNLIRSEWRKLAQDGVTEAELQDAKNAVIGSYLLGLTSTGGIAGALLGIQLDNLGIDYVERREKLLGSVTVEDIKRVAKRFLDEGKLAVVVVGDPTNLTGTSEEHG